MKKVRFGVVGLGMMGLHHAKTLVGHAAAAQGANFAQKKSSSGRGPFCLGAVCDVVSETAERVGAELGVRHFTDAQEMYDSGLVDAVIVTTPHYFHPAQVIGAARAGLQVLCEKPLAVTVGEARAMVAECRKRKVAFGVMLQQRTRGIMIKAKQMIESGRLGDIFRVSMICSSWYRSQHYYDSGTWRGTWAGEGGGVLINQAPHSLDLFQWLGGMPTRIVATVDTRAHDIEVEDTANAICEYKDGRMGYIYATTAEAPGMEQFMVCGDKGTLIVQDNTLRFGKLDKPLSTHLRVDSMWDSPKCKWQEVAWKEPRRREHAGVIHAFAAHILRDTPMIATGAEAVNELELSNAIYIAGYKNKPVELPVDAAEIDALIGKLVRERSSAKGEDLRKPAKAALRKLGLNAFAKGRK